MFRRGKSRDRGERIPVYKPAPCLGEVCEYYEGNLCNSRWELLIAEGKSGGTDRAPFQQDSRYALYGQVCMSTEEQVVIRLHADSPNGKASMAELVGRMGQYEDERIVLNTPPDAVHFQ